MDRMKSTNTRSIFLQENLLPPQILQSYPFHSHDSEDQIRASSSTTYTITMPGIIRAIAPVVDTDYKLRRDNRESLRLTTQHYCLTERQGWLLHPDIDEALSKIEHPQIVDVATGTGIWAIDAARLYPSATFTGLDISDAQYPPTWTWPRNVGFGILDLLGEVPAHLQGKFDVVHCRLLLAAGPSVDKSIFIERFSKLLKPGGWLQWDELSWPTKYIVIPPQTPTDSFHLGDADNYPLIRACGEFLGMDVKNGWFQDFEAVMNKGGLFEQADLHVVPIRPHLLKTETDLSVQVMTELMEVLINKGNIKDETTLSRLRSAVAQAHIDREEGLMFSYRWNVGIAKRRTS